MILDKIVIWPLISDEYDAFNLMPVLSDLLNPTFPPGTCDGGIFTYEKTTGHFLRTAAQDPLQTDNTAPGITSECSKLCSGEGSDCPAFAVDYAGQRCFKLDRNTQVRRQCLKRLPPNLCTHSSPEITLSPSHPQGISQRMAPYLCDIHLERTRET